MSNQKQYANKVRSELMRLRARQVLERLYELDGLYNRTIRHREEIQQQIDDAIEAIETIGGML